MELARQNLKGIECVPKSISWGPAHWNTPGQPPVVISSQSVQYREREALRKDLPHHLTHFGVNAFADDTAYGLADIHELVKLEELLELFCKASGALVSKEKSFIVPIGREWDERNQGIIVNSSTIREWCVEMKPFRYLGPKLGHQIEEEIGNIWDAEKRKVITSMKRLVFHELPLSIRARMINIYCFSKILFLIKFTPPPAGVLEKIQQEAKKAIYKDHPAHPVAGQLTTPRRFGGLGLIDLKRDVLPLLGKWVLQLLTRPIDECSLHNIVMRYRLDQKAIALPPFHERAEYNRLTAFHFDPSFNRNFVFPERRWTAVLVDPLSDPKWNPRFRNHLSVGMEFRVADIEMLMPSRWFIQGIDGSPNPPSYLGTWRETVSLSDALANRENWYTVFANSYWKSPRYRIESTKSLLLTSGISGTKPHRRSPSI